MRHPTQQQLFEYTESLLDRAAPVSVDLASHVNRCPRCTREVARIRKSLHVTAAADELEPHTRLTRQILLAARQEQQARRPGLLERVWLLRVLTRAAAGVCVLLAGLLVFSIAFPAQHGPEGLARESEPAAASAGPVPASSTALADEIAVLRQALETARADNPSPAQALLWERAERARADANAAITANHDNPGHPGPRTLLSGARERERDALRRLYLGLNP